MNEGWIVKPWDGGLIYCIKFYAPEKPLNPEALVPSKSLNRSLKYLISYRLLKSLPLSSSI